MYNRNVFANLGFNKKHTEKICKRLRLLKHYVYDKEDFISDEELLERVKDFFSDEVNGVTIVLSSEQLGRKILLMPETYFEDLEDLEKMHEEYILNRTYSEEHYHEDLNSSCDMLF